MNNPHGDRPLVRSAANVTRAAPNRRRREHRAGVDQRSLDGGRGAAREAPVGFMARAHAAQRAVDWQAIVGADADDATLSSGHSFRRSRARRSRRSTALLRPSAQAPAPVIALNNTDRPLWAGVGASPCAQRRPRTTRCASRRTSTSGRVRGRRLRRRARRRLCLREPQITRLQQTLASVKSEANAKLKALQTVLGTVQALGGEAAQGRSPPSRPSPPSKGAFENQVQAALISWKKATAVRGPTSRGAHG